MLKILLCGVIILASGGLGILTAQKFTERLRDLEDLKAMVKILETEMRYKKDPLPRAFARIAEYKDNRAMDLLWECSQQMQRSQSIGHCWELALSAAYENSCLKENDLIIIKDMGLQLGKSNLTGQTAMFSFINDKLNAQIREAEQEKKSKGKMYKSLGFGIGVMLAIILI